MTDPTLPLEFHAGAGQIVSFPFYLSCISRNEQDQPRHYKEQAYFVCPAAHIGRVVTGVILVSDKVSVSPEIMSHLPEGLAMEVLNKFGMSAISFADKLAEQGYKVLVVDLSSTSVVNSWRIDINSSTQDLVKIKIELLENASKFLKKDNDIQRVALMGVGNAGDVVLQASIDSASLADSAIVMCPNGSIPWKDPSSSSKNIIPTLVLIGDRNAYVHSTEFKLLEEYMKNDHAIDIAGFVQRKLKIFPNQGKSFAFSNITDEDSATQAIAEVLDWLMTHLHRFRIASGTSDGDPWWPQGLNGPFLNVGLQRWQDIRTKWTTPSRKRPPRPPPVSSHLIFDGLSSMRRSFDLPQRMALGDVIELLVEIWDDVQS